MRRRASLLLSVIVVLGLNLSGLAISHPLGTTASGTSVPAAPTELATAPQSDQLRAGADSPSPARFLSRRRLQPDEVEHWRDLCSGPRSIRLPKLELCTHGPDPAPPGFAEGQPVPALAPRAAARAAASIPCATDDVSDYRVLVLYVRGADVASRYTQMLPSIRAWIGVANQIFQSSAAATGGSRGLRFVQAAACQPAVNEVVLSPAGDDDFGTMVSELKSQGYDRIYLSFVDTVDAGICGIGTIWSDDRASVDNWNNVGPSYARVDAWCWSGEVAAHELMHNFGGVQLSAPNSSGGFHCIDGYDVMCYRDSARSPAMRYDCPNPADDETRLDCGHQDYYNTSPPAGSYLATHWNAADDRFLIGASTASPPPVDNNPPKQKHGKGHKHKKDKKRHGGHHRR
jgi:hypothetical protein